MSTEPAPEPHRRCDRDVDCPCWNAGAVAEAQTRRLPERTRQIVDYIRALAEGEPELDQIAIAQRVADVFLPAVRATPSSVGSDLRAAHDLVPFPQRGNLAEVRMIYCRQCGASQPVESAARDPLPPCQVRP